MLKIGKISSSLYHFKLKDIIERTANPIEVVPDQKYTQIGIRSHGKGIFIKEEVTGADLGNKRVFWIESDCFIVNIVFAWERAVARTTSDLEGLIASHRFPMYKVNSLKVDLDYFTRLFLTRKGQMLLELASPGGAGRNKTLGQKEFLNLEIDLPTLEIQKYVSSFLKLIDKKIQLQQEKIDLLKEQKKGFMQKIFSQELRFKDENGQEFPEWGNKLIGEIAEVIMGQSPDGSSYSEDSSDTILVQGNADLKNGKIVPRIYTSQITKMATIGDIILTVRAPVGIVAKCNIPACIGRGVCAIRSDEFLFYYLDYYYITSQWIKLSQGSTFDSVNSSDIKNIIVPQPCTKEKEIIVSLFDRLTHKINLEEEILSELEKQKQAFMQQMFI